MFATSAIAGAILRLNWIYANDAKYPDNVVHEEKLCDVTDYNGDDSYVTNVPLRRVAFGQQESPRIKTDFSAAILAPANIAGV